jgi:hypothetical protein
VARKLGEQISIGAIDDAKASNIIVEGLWTVYYRSETVSVLIGLLGWSL